MFDKLLIGKEIEILSASDSTLIGTVGTILDETKYTLIVKSAIGRSIRIPKSVVRFGIHDKNAKMLVVEGNSTFGTPVERIRG